MTNTFHRGFQRDPFREHGHAACDCESVHACTYVCMSEACEHVKTTCNRALEVGEEGPTETGARKWSAYPWSFSFHPRLRPAPPALHPQRARPPSLSRARVKGQFHLPPPHCCPRGPSSAHLTQAWAVLENRGAGRGPSWNGFMQAPKSITKGS